MWNSDRIMHKVPPKFFDRLTEKGGKEKGGFNKLSPAKNADLHDGPDTALLLIDVINDL